MQNGYSRTISSRIHKMGCEDTYILDKRGNKKDQNCASTLVSGYHKHPSDADYIKVADYRTDEGIRIRHDGDAPCLTASHSSENEPSRMQELVISHNLQQRSPNRPSKLEGQPGGSGPLSKEDGTTYCLESHNLQAVEVKPVLTPEIMAYSKSHRTGSSDADKKRKNYGKVEHRIKTDEFNTLSTGKGCSNMSSANYVKEEPNYGSKALNETLENANLDKDDVKALDLYNRKAQDHAPALTEPHHNTLRLYENSSIRRLTPTECECLQGFPDGWTEGQSDTQRYKQLGNAVSVPVVKAVGERLLKHIP